MAFKFMQPPNLDQAGVDVLCTSFPASVRKLADDWVCEATGEISKVTFWISFLGDWAPPYMPMPLTGVHLSVHADIPQGPHGHSCPGPLLWMRDFGIPEFEVTLEATGAELFADPPVGVTGSDTQVYRVDCPIPQGQRFFQSAGNVYWLDVTIDTSEQGWQQAGWKTSLAGLAPDFAVWTEAPAPEPMPMDWLRIESLPGGPGNLSFAIETEVVATTTTRPPTTTVPPTTTTKPPTTTTRPPTTTPPPVETKYTQPPDLTPLGMDIRACNVPGGAAAVVVADDWPCDRYGRLTAIRLWCSYKADELPPGGPAMPFDALHLRIYADVPHGPREHSCPGEMLWEWLFVPGVDCAIAPPVQVEGEWFWDPESQEPPMFPGDNYVWMVACDLGGPGVPPFVQLGTPNEPRVYWLAASAVLPPGNPPVRFGWKTSPAHWNDAACYAVEAGGPLAPPDWYGMTYPPPHQLAGQPVDMAFDIDQQPLPYLPHPADTGPGAPDWRCSPPEVLAYAAEWLGGATPEFQGVPLDGPGVAQAYILRAAAITLAHYQARYEDMGSADPINSAAHPQRWRELPD